MLRFRFISTRKFAPTVNDHYRRHRRAPPPGTASRALTRVSPNLVSAYTGEAAGRKSAEPARRTSGTLTAWTTSPPVASSSMHPTLSTRSARTTRPLSSRTHVIVAESAAKSSSLSTWRTGCVLQKLQSVIRVPVSPRPHGRRRAARRSSPAWPAGPAVRAPASVRDSPDHSPRSGR